MTFYEAVAGSQWPSPFFTISKMEVACDSYAGVFDSRRSKCHKAKMMGGLTSLSSHLYALETPN